MSKENNVQETEEVIEDAVEETVDNELEEKYKELEDKYLRLCAEYDNYQKRTTREKEACYGDALIDTAAVFLPIVDDLSRALEIEVTNEEAQKVKEGVELVAKKLKEVFSKLDIEEIKAVGEDFDPNLHNAILHVEDDTVADNTVVEEFMKGYIYKGTRVVRHSMVKVAN